MTTIYAALIIVGLGVLAVGVGTFLALAQHGVSEDPELEREYEAGPVGVYPCYGCGYRNFSPGPCLRCGKVPEREGREILERERYG